MKQASEMRERTNLGGEVRLVKVVDVGHVGSMDGCRTDRTRRSAPLRRLTSRAGRELTLQGQGGIGTDEQGDCTSSTNRPGTSRGVDGNITRDNEGVAAVPARALDPVDGVEERGRSTVASVLGIDTLDVRVGAKEVHEDGLGRL